MVSAVSLLSYAFCRRGDDPRLVGLWLHVALAAVVIGLIAGAVIVMNLLFCRIVYACGLVGRIVANVVYWPSFVAAVLGLYVALACSGYWFGNIVAPYISTYIAPPLCRFQCEWFMGIPVNDVELFQMTGFVELIISVSLGYIVLCLGAFEVKDFADATRPSQLA